MAQTVMGRTILVVDDSPGVCQAARWILQIAGYEVLWRTDAHEALETCRRHAGPIDLVLADILMPEMDGRELVSAMAETRPGVRTVLMSGAVPPKDVHPGVSFLPKPYRARDLLRVVEEALYR